MQMQQAIDALICWTTELGPEARGEENGEEVPLFICLGSGSSDVNKDLTFKDKDKDQTLKAKDQDKDQTYKDQDKDQTTKDKDKDQTFKAKDQDKD